MRPAALAAVLAVLVAAPGLSLAAAPAHLAAAPAPPKETVIVGLTGKSIVVTPKLLEGLDRGQAVLINDGKTQTYQGVMLTDLLRLVGAPTGLFVHGPADRDYLVVTGADGFRAVYTLAETDRSIQKHDVILADHMDGRPLDARDAPFRLVVDGDQQPARSVYGVTRIELRQLP